MLLIFPHQLFSKHPGLKLKPSKIVLIEDTLFFGDKRYPATFHKQKLWLHRATMKRYAADLTSKDHDDELSGNPRWAMMCSAAKKMDKDKRNTYMKNAGNYSAARNGKAGSFPVSL